MKPANYLAGAAKLPGRTNPRAPKDTIKAVLSPNEAVLNAPAAEALGRGKIRQLNAAGNAKRGTDSKGKPLHAAGGHAPSGMESAMGAHADSVHPVRLRG